MAENLMNTPTNNQLGMVEESRALSEIKGKIFLAKQFPRNEQVAIDRILAACENVKVAENAAYVYGRGDSEVKGASIRLAEVVAQYWGNLDSGVVELEQRKGESTVKAYAWDLESNCRDEKIFTVKHERSTKKGNYALTDPRDIYEAVANSAARRKRACILAVIPSYIFDLALDKCEATLNAAVKGNATIEETRENIFNAFVTLKPDITREALAAVVNKEFDKIDTKDIVKLRHLYTAVTDGFVKIDVALKLEDEDAPTLAEDGELDAINKKLGTK